MNAPKAAPAPYDDVMCCSHSSTAGGDSIILCFSECHLMQSFAHYKTNNKSMHHPQHADVGLISVSADNSKLKYRSCNHTFFVPSLKNNQWKENEATINRKKGANGRFLSLTWRLRSRDTFCWAADKRKISLYSSHILHVLCFFTKLKVNLWACRWIVAAVCI